MSGRLSIVGIGPGPADLVTPRAAQALATASDLVGYHGYLARVPQRPDQVRHGSDNRAELARARHALALAAAGRLVAVVSSGDAGVFAMASAVFEAIEAEPVWASLDVDVVAGVSAMLAVAARLGAPLGHDFCVMSLSDNLKPWALVLERLRAAARAGFVIALFNPASAARPWQFGAALEVLREELPDAVPVIFATAVERPEERISVTTLAAADPARADMRTLVLVGSRETRRIPRPGQRDWVYTPRRVA